MIGLTLVLVVSEPIFGNGVQRGFESSSAQVVTGWVVTEAEGHMVARAMGAGSEGSPRTARKLPLASGVQVPEGVTVFTPPGARLEVRREDGACWRLGQRTAWRLDTSDSARLAVGSALAVVPNGVTFNVTSGESSVVVCLESGVWLLTAQPNGGLKIVALENGRLGRILPAVASSSPLVAASASGAEMSRGGGDRSVLSPTPRPLRLAAGDVVFAPPGMELDFSPPLTVHLVELLTTSRLVSGFSQPLPQSERLFALAQAQRERIERYSGAFVGSARRLEEFDLVVPKVEGKR